MRIRPQTTTKNYYARNQIGKFLANKSANNVLRYSKNIFFKLIPKVISICAPQKTNRTHDNNNQQKPSVSTMFCADCRTKFEISNQSQLKHIRFD